MIEFPDKKYQIIYADCPWDYNDKCNSGKRGAGFKYKTQPLDWNKSLPVADIADEDRALFFWATFPLFAEALEVIAAWGFKYKTAAFLWRKIYRHARTECVLMGNYTRSNMEACLIATRGKPKRIDKGVRQIVTAAPREPHRKPDEVRDGIVKLMGDIPRIELFARQQSPGWDVWGNETNKFSHAS